MTAKLPTLRDQNGLRSVKTKENHFVQNLKKVILLISFCRAVNLANSLVVLCMRAAASKF